MGPPFTGKRRLAWDVARQGVVNDEGAIVISLRDTAEQVRTLVGSDQATDLVGVVDCVTDRVGKSKIESDLVRYASTPADVTDIGIKFSEFIEYFHCERGVERNRVVFDSVTTLLQYATLQTVFRFLHAVTTRVTEVDGLGVYVVESTVHDEETMGTVRELFDGVIETSHDGGLAVDLPSSGPATSDEE